MGSGTSSLLNDRDNSVDRLLLEASYMGIKVHRTSDNHPLAHSQPIQLCRNSCCASSKLNENESESKDSTVTSFCHHALREELGTRWMAPQPPPEGNYSGVALSFDAHLTHSSHTNLRSTPTCCYSDSSDVEDACSTAGAGEHLALWERQDTGCEPHRWLPYPTAVAQDLEMARAQGDCTERAIVLNVGGRKRRYVVDFARMVQYAPIHDETAESGCGHTIPGGSVDVRRTVVSSREMADAHLYGCPPIPLSTHAKSVTPTIVGSSISLDCTPTKAPRDNHTASKTRTALSSASAPYFAANGMYELAHYSTVYASHLSPCGAYLATGCSDHVLRLWNTSVGREVARRTMCGRVLTLAFSQRYTLMAVGTDRNGLYFYDYSPGVREEKQDALMLRAEAVEPNSRVHQHRIYALCCLGDTKWITTDATGRMVLLDVEKFGTVRTWQHPFRKAIYTVQPFLHDGIGTTGGGGNTFLSAGDESQIRAHDLRIPSGGTAQSSEDWTNSVVQKFDGLIGAVWAVAVSPQGPSTIVGGDMRGNVLMWDARRAASPLCRFRGHGSRSIHSAVYLSQHLIATAGRDGFCHIWKEGGLPNRGSFAASEIDEDGVLLGSQIASYRHHHFVSQVDYNAATQLLVTASFDKKCTIMCGVDAQRLSNDHPNV